MKIALYLQNFRSRPDLIRKVNDFSQIKHVSRDVSLIKRLDPDWRSHCLEREPGEEGLFYLGDPNGADVFAHAAIPDGSVASGAPSAWCPWFVEPEFGVLVWDGRSGCPEDLAVAWLSFLIAHFFRPFALSVNGSFVSDGNAYVVRDNVILRSPVDDPHPYVITGTMDKVCDDAGKAREALSDLITSITPFTEELTSSPYFVEAVFKGGFTMRFDIREV